MLLRLTRDSDVDRGFGPVVSPGLHFGSLRLDWIHHVESEGKAGCLGRGRVVERSAEQMVNRVAMLNIPNHASCFGRAASSSEGWVRSFAAVYLCKSRMSNLETKIDVAFAGRTPHV